MLFTVEEMVVGLVKDYKITISEKSVKDSSIISQITECINLGTVKPRVNKNGSVKLIDGVYKFVESKEDTFKVIIAGVRNLNNVNVVFNSANKLLKSKFEQNVPVEIVSGCARGTDTIGEIYAEKLGLSVKKFPAQWDKYGRRAGYLRNEEMAIYADALIAFWDGQSKGTKHMIDLAKKHNIPVKVINCSKFVG